MINAQFLKIHLKVKFIFWIRFEVLFRLIFKGTFQEYVLRINFNFNAQGKRLWLRLLLMPKLKRNEIFKY